MSKNKKTAVTQKVVAKKPSISMPTKASFNFKKPIFNSKGPSFKMSYRTQNRGAK